MKTKIPYALCFFISSFAIAGFVVGHITADRLIEVSIAEEEYNRGYNDAEQDFCNQTTEYLMCIERHDLVPKNVWR